MLPPPILTRKRNAVPLIAAMLLVGGLSGYFGMQVGARPYRNITNISVHWTDMPLLMGLMLLVILVHELGHVAGGLAGGMRFLMLTVGPFRVHRSGDTMRVSFNNSINLWGGVAVMLPLATDRIRRRFALMIGGGPLASLLLAGLGAALFALSTGRLSLLGMVLGIASAGIFIVTIIPLTAGGFTSAGGQLLALRRSVPGAELRMVISAVAGASLGGTRPRDYDAGLIQHAFELDGPAPMRLITSMLAALRQIDRDEDPSAHFQQIMQHFGELPTGQREGVALWIAWYHAAVRKDHATATAWAEASRGGLVEPIQRDLLEATLAVAAGDRAAAASAAVRGASRTPGIDPGGEQLVRMLLDRIRTGMSAV